jgi:hypothetical protein
MANDVRVNRYAIADLESLHTLSDFDDSARKFVSDDNRISGRKFPSIQSPICTANTARGDLDQHLPELGDWFFPVYDLDIPGFIKYSSLHTFSPLIFNIWC